MRFYHILFKKFRFFLLFLPCILLTGLLVAQEKAGTKEKFINVSIKVVDDNGTPVPKAQVVVGEGMIHTETDNVGSIALKTYPGDFITISSSGYEKGVFLIENILENNTVILKKSKLYMTSDDNIPLPFSNLKKRTVTGSYKVVTGDQLEKYPSTDIRNAFTGLVPGLQVSERNGSPGSSAEEKMATYGVTEKIGVYARGRSLAYIIDNVYTDVTEIPLDPSEIESATIITDIVGKAMYGPAGADGIVLIKTKRGRTNERILNVNLEDGVGIIDRMPEWASGADYATLNNKARKTDGLTENYSTAAIDAYAINDPYDMYHPSVNFRDMMLNNSMSFKRANISSQGGNDALQYFSNVVYDGEGDIFKIGPKADYNRISARSNLDIRINDAVKARFDIYGGLSFRRSPNYGYATSESSSLTDIMEFNSAITSINTTPPIAFPVYANNSPTLKSPWFGVSNSYKFNPIGDLTRNGYYTETSRIGSATFALDYDMKDIIQGLKSRTEFGFNVLNLLRIGKAKNYIAYIATPSISPKTSNDTILLTKSHDGVDVSDLSNLHDYYFQRFEFHENLSYEKSFGLNNIQTSLSYLLYKVAKNGIEETQRQQNLIWTGLYTFNDRYSVQGVINYAGSNSLDKGNRFNAFPSIGASWVISEESFMSGIKFINYLKLRGEAGILGYESFLAPYYYQERWTGTTGTAFGPFTTGQWFGSNYETTVYRTYPSRIGNPDLTWEKRKEITFGIDALMFNQKLSMELNYYNNLRVGQISQTSNVLPYLVGVSSSLPYFNYNSTRYFGIEAGVQYADNLGKFGYSIGGNATVSKTKLEKYNEPSYRYDYQPHTGTPSDTWWGLTYLGKFESDAEALVVPQLYDAVLHKGDLKYKDMNGDGVVDDNDQSAIGHGDPRLYYSLNAKLNYGNFEISILGTGCAFFDIALTNSYFWNGWGDNNYSNFVKDNLDEAYPRLTYYKVNNNFAFSDFWLTKGDFFKIQNLELAYTVPLDKLQFIRSRGVRLYVRGANLLTISKVKDVDPESLNSGVSVYPLFRTFTGGIKLTF
jgi:TonB-linked SusC/RagA family outer membrane protein